MPIGSVQSPFIVLAMNWEPGGGGLTVVKGLVRTVDFHQDTYPISVYGRDQPYTVLDGPKTLSLEILVRGLRQVRGADLGK